MAEIHQLPLPAPGLDDRPTPDEVARVPFEHVRLMEAVLFASSSPVPSKLLAGHLPDGADLGATLKILRWTYSNRGVQLERSGDAWAFRTAPDLAPHLSEAAEPVRKLSRAALETLSVIAYHQPVTRAEIEEVRGVSLSRGTLETLLELGWIKLRGRRRTPGRPVTYGTTPRFLDHFGLETTDDLPDLAELKGAGLLDNRVPTGSSILPRSEADLVEDPIEPSGDADEEQGSTDLFRPFDDEPTR